MTPIIDAGRDYYKRDPEALLISVARKAAAQYASKTDQLAFTEGYSQARAQHDAFKNEQAQATAPTEDPTADPA